MANAYLLAQMATLKIKRDFVKNATKIVKLAKDKLLLTVYLVK
jgi:hypothetical protein